MLDEKVAVPLHRQKEQKPGDKDNKTQIIKVGRRPSFKVKRLKKRITTQTKRQGLLRVKKRKEKENEKDCFDGSSHDDHDHELR